jgi:CHAT domain-containing protein/tetratricopeptide (TPR) repeat protein
MRRRGKRTRWNTGVGLLLVSTWLLGWLWPALACSEPPPADPGQQVVERMISLMRQAEALQAEGKEAEAILLVEQVVALGEQEFGPDALSLLIIPLERLSALYRTHGDQARAALLAQHAQEIRAREEVRNRLLSLMQQSQALQNEGKDGEAIPLLEEAVTLGEQGLGSEALPLALALDLLATLYRKHDDLTRAEPLYQRALAIREHALGPEHPDVADILTSLASLAAAKEEFGHAESLYHRALAVQERALGPEHPTVALTRYMLASLLQRQGEYGRAEPLLRRVLATQEQTLGAEHTYVALTLNNLAFILGAKGDYAQAEALYRRSLAMQEKVLGPEHSAVAATLNNLAALYHVKGDYVQAEPLALRALALREKAQGPEHPAVATHLTTLALLYHAKGDTERAVPLLQRALTLREQALGPEHSAVAATLVNLASILNRQGETAQAEAFYQRALAIQEKVRGPTHPVVASTLNSLAVLVLGRGDLLQADAFLRRALAIREQALGPDHPDVAEVLNSLGYLAFLQQDAGQEEARYRRALAIAEQTLGPDHPTVAAYLNNLATVFWGRSDVPQTVAFLTRAAAIREHHLALLLTTGSEEQKRRYMATLASETDATITFHVQAAPQSPPAADLAVTTLLRRKGRVLDAMADQITALRRRLDPDDRALLDQWSAVRSALAQLTLQAESKTPTASRLAEKTRLTAEVERLEAEISTRSAVFRTEVRPVTLFDVQQAIPEDAALIEMVVYCPYDPQASHTEGRFGATRYVAYVLRHQGPLGWVDLGDAAAIDREVERFRRALRQPTSPDVQQAGRALDELVMRPVRSLLGQTRHLLLSADGALNLVPFGAFVDEQQQYLVEHYTITYFTSGRDLLRLQASSPSRAGAVVIANPRFASRGGSTDATAAMAEPSPTARRSVALANVVFTPLPGTQEEAAALGTILPHVTVFTDAHATETQLKRVHGLAILHVATHGFFLADQPQTAPQALRGLLLTELDHLTAPPDPTAPRVPSENPLLRAGLALAGANDRQGGDGEDGVLTALEAAGLDLWGTRLVVLSACETGLGDVQNGDGVYGLRRALVLAGVESQVMSLWQVSDEATRDLMVAYYQRLQAGEGRTEALRQVQLSMLRGQAWQHPFFWASFIQSGDWRTLAP